jgi:four helix bundle protein
MLAAYDVGLELIRELRGVVIVLKKHDRDLANQLQRAATSVCLNVAEGRDRSGGDQRHCYEIAAGSASEVHAALEATDAWGWPVATAPSLVTVRRLRALLYGLTHGPRRPA